MNKTILAFVAGAVIGSAATWQYVKKKYERIAQEEIDSVIEVFRQKEKDLNDKLDTAHHDLEESKENQKKAVTEYKNVLNSVNYTDYSSNKKEKEVKPVSGPYVIPPEEFGEKEDEGYEIVTLMYYADGYLADDEDYLIEDVEGAIGRDSLTHFGEYEDDSVFVRNDDRKCDYEILLSERDYEEVIETKKARQGYR